ncbi:MULTISPECIES: hypothetical protein [unclassified Roseateles]|uniref:hypothetical protein n=1 Tax=unclassified Roseateles TaxID=2626991 RepID=UPI0006F8D697|nr:MULTISPECIES: hypothetical protein [unclassified Roseateles]KQW46391.1 hypothetical protein ASC81_08255 [Pelomonas sp. Root405]KRA73441.1 hypothetical protein ASD88_08255 [Pelomonas sp. Root662]
MSQPLTPALAQATHRQSRSVRDLGLACCAYLLLFSGGVLLWLFLSGAPVHLGMAGICALSPLAALALALGDRSDARQYTLHMLAATLAFPILLLFWAGSVDIDTPPAPPSAASLDAQALFNGAEAVQDTDMRAGGILLLRAGRFADGSELRLSRFADANAARNYVALLAQAMPTDPFTDAGRRGLRLVNGGVGTATLVVFERHGADLLELRAADSRMAMARWAAQRVPVPEQGRAPATAEPAASWPFFTAMAITQGLVFVALIAWAGSHTTGVPALHDAPVATPGELRSRLLSLARPGGPFDITPVEVDGQQAWRVDVSPSPRRRHHITLHIDERRGWVRVHEKLGIDGDAPQDAEEASLRHVGDDLVDAARPDAQRVWSSALQATMVVPARLAAVPLRLFPGRAELPTEYAARLDGEGVLTALCALVTRSGWHWQPRLFGRRV